MSDARLELREGDFSPRPILYLGFDGENLIPEGMLPPEAFPYENSLDIELALNFFVERVRALEKEKEQLLGVIGSMQSIMKERNSMTINLVSMLNDAMNKQVQKAMDESLKAAFALVQEALDGQS